MGVNPGEGGQVQQKFGVEGRAVGPRGAKGGRAHLRKLSAPSPVLGLSD